MPQNETACLTLTDVHYGKKTASFDPDICVKRFEALSQKTAMIRDCLTPSYAFDGLRIFALGDINDGTDIYASQPHHQAISNVEEQATQAAKMLAKFLRQQADIWGAVHVDCVAGNHGRGGKLSSGVHEAANWDTVTYRYADLLTQNDPRITISIPDPADLFVRVVNVRGHNLLLHHGHWVKSWLGIPYYGLQRRVLNWSIVAKWPEWSIMLSGHFHCKGDIALSSRKKVLLSGTMVTDDDFALLLGVESINEWWMFGVSDRHLPTWQFGIDVAPDMETPKSKRRPSRRAA